MNHTKLVKYLSSPALLTTPEAHAAFTHRILQDFSNKGAERPPVSQYVMLYPSQSETIVGSLAVSIEEIAKKGMLGGITKRYKVKIREELWDSVTLALERSLGL